MSDQGRSLIVRCTGPIEAEFSSPPSTLDGNAAHIWFSRLDDLRYRVQEFEQLLDQDEKERAARFRFPIDRERYIIGHGLLRKLLSRYTGIDPIEIRTIRGKFGKPYLPDRSIEFNLSDTKDAVLIAFARHEIGADLETMNRMVDHLKVAEHYFTPNEIDSIKSAGDHKRRFLELWTRKEAVLKASGVGIMDDLRVLEVHAELNHCTITNEDFIADAAAEYEVRTWHVGSDHLVSLAAVQDLHVKFVTLSDVA
ncbi:MAG: 4'-phosphopantetheinyl transferase superfamily protein [Bacteroidota bacterium]|nr:4'-phosphopantetheinyl transferase superfamily protein [Bacteroidota bacterium]